MFYNKLNKLLSAWAGLLLSSQWIALVRSCAVARIIAAPPHRKTIGLQSKDNRVIKRWGLGSDFIVSRLPWNDLTEHLSWKLVYIYYLFMNILNCKEFTDKIYATELHKSAVGWCSSLSYTHFILLKES